MTSRLVLSTFVLVVIGVWTGSLHAQEKKMCELSDPVVARADDASCPARVDSQLLPDELIMPLPCGQAMVFRKVVVPGAHALDNQEIVLGGANVEDMNSKILDLTLSSRQGVIAGSFAHGEGLRSKVGQSNLEEIKDKSYYLGKYEVFKHQYLLFELGMFDKLPDVAACDEYNKKIEKLNAKKVRPVGGISWFDSVFFSRAYSNWLIDLGLKHVTEGGQPVLPWEHGSTSYIRLPSETEWEYAARGGVARSQDVTIQGYRIIDPNSNNIREARVDEISVTTGGQGARLRPVGTRPPNVFGLYDMVGNVDEIVLDTFQAARPGASYAQVGGYVIKGGNIQTSAAVIGVGYRREVPFFGANGETKAKTTGFRLAIGTPVFISGTSAGQAWKGGSANPVFVNALQDASSRLTASVGDHQEDLEKSLNELKERLATEDVEQSELIFQLQALQSKLASSNAELNANAQRVLYERFRSSVFIARSINQLGVTIRRLEKQIPRIEKLINEEEDQKRREQLEQRLETGLERISEREAGIKASFGVYIEQLIETAKSTRIEIADTTRKLDQEFTRTGLNGYQRYIEIATTHLSGILDRGGNPSAGKLNTWLNEVDTKRSDRAISKP